MSRGARVFWWAVVLAACGAPFVHQAIQTTPNHAIPEFVRKRGILDWRLASALVALPVAVGGTVIVLRKRAARRTRFRPAPARAANLSLIAFALFVAAGRSPWLLRKLGAPIDADWSLTIRYAAAVVVILWARRAIGRRELDDHWGLHLGPRVGREVGVGLVAGAWTLCVSTLFLMAALHAALEPGLYRTSLVWWCARIVLLAPVVEEVYFRGALYTALRRSQSWLAAAGVVGLLFAVMHGYPRNPWITASHFAFGFLMCLVREWRGSVLACVVAHAAGNGLIAAHGLILLWD